MDGLTPKSRRIYFIAEESADMRKSIRCFAVVMMVFLATMIFAGRAPAQEAKFDSDTISGLGARNIGSAAMSGRVAALAAVKEDGRLTVYVGAASGGVWKSTDGGDSWTNMGLPNSERIAKIIVDPKNGSTVYVCVPGKLWSDSEDRGV